MSTTGHYKRYIKQFPGWSDNCDTMYQSVSNPLEGICKFCEWDNDCRHDHKNCYDQLGYFSVEHYRGNKHAFCQFIYRNPHVRDWYLHDIIWDGWMPEELRVYEPFKYGGNKIVLEYTGVHAIEHVLEMVKTITPEMMVDLIFREQFYNRSYVDYMKYALQEMVL